MSDLEFSERRAAPRLPGSGEARVVRVDGAEAAPATGRTVNISPGGVRLELADALPLRSEVRVSLPIGAEMLTVSGSVVYLEVVDARRCSAGIQFTGLERADRERIDRYLKRRR